VFRHEKGTAMVDTSRVAELKDALQTKLNYVNEGLDKGVKVTTNDKGEKCIEIGTEDFKSLRKAHHDSMEIAGLIQTTMGVKAMEGVLNDLNGHQGGQGSVSLAASGGNMQQMKSLGSMFTDSQEFKDMIQSKARKMDAPFEIQGISDFPKMGQVKDVWSGVAGNVSYQRQMGNIQFDPLVPRAFRQVRVRDLFPVVATSANMIDYFKVTGYAAGEGATSVPDYDTTDEPNTFGLKPHTNLQFSSHQAPVRTIAHWEAAHRNVLDDVPQLQGTINNELMYGIQLEEDRQILLGSGNNDELLGILNTTGIQTYTQAATGGEQMADTLRKAATRVLLAYYQPTGFVLHPYDWEQVELQKGSGDGQYMLVTNVAIGASAQVWRQPVVETAAMPQGTFLTGAFGLGAQLYDRQISNVRIAEQHADFFVRNAIVILAEERLALATKRPESFVMGTFTLDHNQ
jgi:HK97 family phage major capsid protein